MRAFFAFAALALIAFPITTVDAQQRETLYVSNEGSHSISVIDTRTRTVVKTIDLGFRARGIHLSPDGRRVYVALSDDLPMKESAGDRIAVIDVATGKLVARYSSGSDPENFAVTHDGKMLYASNEDAGIASAINLRTGKVVASAVVGIEPEGVAISPNGRWVYVTAETSNSVSVIDTRTNKAVSTFLVDVRPRAAAFSPDGKRAYISAEVGGSITVVSTATNQPIQTISLEHGEGKPVGIVISRDGKWLYAANGRTSSVSFVDLVRNEVVTNIPVGRRPWGIALSRDGRTLYTANGLSNDVSVIDVASSKVVATIKVGARPWGVALGYR